MKRIEREERRKMKVLRIVEEEDQKKRERESERERERCIKRKKEVLNVGRRRRLKGNEGDMEEREVLG